MPSFNFDNNIELIESSLCNEYEEDDGFNEPDEYYNERPGGLQDKEVEDYVDEYVPFLQDGQFEKYFYQTWISWKSDRDGNWKIKKLE